jgi:cytochrome c oxidase subunit 2
VSSIQSALAPAGPQAARLAHLWWIFFWVCLAVYVLTIAFFAWAIIRSRRNAAPIPDHRLAYGVGTASALSIVILFALLVTSVAIGRDVGTFAQSDPRQLEIDVTGHQWWWEVKYPDALAPSQSITTANEIHIPIRTPILLRLATRDVIHSIWIPSLHGKRDLINGRVNKLWIQADKPGVYRGQCAEYCGMQHAHMALVVIAETPEEFAQWKSKQSEGAKAPTSDAALRGMQVFLAAPCGKCHNITGLDAYGAIGPDLTHLESRRTIAAGTLINNRGNLAGWISNAPSIKPGVLMPPNVMTASEMNDLLAYLETLR